MMDYFGACEKLLSHLHWQIDRLCGGVSFFSYLLPFMVDIPLPLSME